MTKELKTAIVFLKGEGTPSQLSVSDTLEKPVATYIVQAMERGDDVKIASNGKVYAIPFHSVDYIEVTSASTAMSDKADPYGCDSNGGGGATVCSSTACDATLCG